jgi:signal peptidase I
VPIRLVIAIMARVILLAATGCLFWSAIPTLWGWKTTTVMSDSMAPAVRAGDIIVAMPISDPSASMGRIILFEDPDHPERWRLHRLVGTTPDGLLTTRGDANAVADSSPVTPTDVRGLAVMRAPALGLPFVWLREGRWELILTTTAIGIGLGLLALGRGGSHRTETGNGAARVLPSALSVIAAVAVVTIVGSSGSAHAAYTTQSPSPVNSLAAADTFGCLARTPLDSPYVRYDLNDAAGASTADTSGNGRTGTLLPDAVREAGDCGNSPSLTLGSLVSSGITLPGPALAPSNTFSVEIWFRTTSLSGGQLIGFGDSASGVSVVADRRIWMTNGGVLRFSIRQNNSVRTISSAETFNDGAWHHAVATLSSNGMRLYVDGLLRASNSAFRTAYHYKPYGSDGYWRVGGDTTTGMPAAVDATLASSIDNAAVYATTALSAIQVAAHYAAGR